MIILKEHFGKINTNSNNIIESSLCFSEYPSEILHWIFEEWKHITIKALKDTIISTKE